MMRSITKPRNLLSALAVALGLSIGAMTVGHAMSPSSARHGAGGAVMHMGNVSMQPHSTWVGVYDGHKDLYLSTDVSNKAQAAMMGINFAPGLQHIRMDTLPEIYLVDGKSAPAQPAIFGSEPGEKDYNPLWHETLLTWKASARPVTIRSDAQVNALEKKGVLTERDGKAVLNCPIVKVTKVSIK